MGIASPNAPVRITATALQAVRTVDDREVHVAVVEGRVGNECISGGDKADKRPCDENARAKAAHVCIVAGVQLYIRQSRLPLLNNQQQQQQQQQQMKSGTERAMTEPQQPTTGEIKGFGTHAKALDPLDTLLFSPYTIQELPALLSWFSVCYTVRVICTTSSAPCVRALLAQQRVKGVPPLLTVTAFFVFACLCVCMCVSLSVCVCLSVWVCVTVASPLPQQC